MRNVKIIKTTITTKKYKLKFFKLWLNKLLKEKKFKLNKNSINITKELSSTNIWLDMINVDNTVTNRTSKFKKNQATYLNTVEDVEIPLIEIISNENKNNDSNQKLSLKE
jgi:hypothetical protein